MASSGRSQPEPLRHRRVQVQGRLPGRVPVRRRPEQVLPRDHRPGASLGHRGHSRGHERPVAVQPARRRDPEGVRRVLPGQLEVRHRRGLRRAPHCRAGGQRHGRPRGRRAPEAAQHVGRLGDGRRRDLPRPRRVPEVQEQPGSDLASDAASGRRHRRRHDEAGLHAGADRRAGRGRRREDRLPRYLAPGSRFPGATSEARPAELAAHPHDAALAGEGPRRRHRADYQGIDGWKR